MRYTTSQAKDYIVLHPRFADLDSILPRPGPAGVQNKDIASLADDIQNDIIKDIKKKKKKEEQEEKRR